MNDTEPAAGLMRLHHEPTGARHCDTRGTCDTPAVLVLQIDTGDDWTVAELALCQEHAEALGFLIASPRKWRRPSQWAALVHLESIYRQVVADVGPGVTRPKFLRAYARNPYGDPPADLRGQLAAIARLHR